MTQEEFNAMLLAVELEEKCDTCFGSGEHHARKYGKCEDCGGSGTQLTDLGKKFQLALRDRP